MLNNKLRGGKPQDPKLGKSLMKNELRGGKPQDPKLGKKMLNNKLRGGKPQDKADKMSIEGVQLHADKSV